MFHGLGTEPLGDFYIFGNSAIYISEMLDIDEYWDMENTFDKSKYSQIVQLKNSLGEKSHVRIIKKSTGDGMSPKIYPYTVIYGDLHYGCGNIEY